MRLLPWESKTALKKSMAVQPPPPPVGYRFTLKGSPRHFEDVKQIIESKGTGKVYFGEALAYERGAGIALWRIRATDFDWMTDLYEWWANMERIEPVQFTFHLYTPDNLMYPALDLRNHTVAEVADFIRTHTSWEGKRPNAAR